MDEILTKCGFRFVPIVERQFFSEILRGLSFLDGLEHVVDRLEHVERQNAQLEQLGTLLF